MSFLGKIELTKLAFTRKGNIKVDLEWVDRLMNNRMKLFPCFLVHIHLNAILFRFNGVGVVDLQQSYKFIDTPKSLPSAMLCNFDCLIC